MITGKSSECADCCVDGLSVCCWRVQGLLTQIWCGELAVNNPVWRLLLCMLLFPLINTGFLVYRWVPTLVWDQFLCFLLLPLLLVWDQLLNKMQINALPVLAVTDGTGLGSCCFY